MKFGYVSWLPQTELMSKLIEELNTNRLMGTKCKKCGAKHLPPRAHCRCGSEDMEWFEAPRKGKILAYTLVTYPPESMAKYAPYIVAVAELEDKSRLLAQLSGVTPRTLKVGMSIQVVSHRVSEDRIAYKFTPL